MAKEQGKRSGGEYSASVRRRRTTRIKPRKRWSAARFAAIVGFLAATLAVLAFVRASLPLQMRQVLDQGVGVFTSVRAFLNNSIAAFIPLALPAPLQGLGDILLIVVGVAIAVLLFRVAEPDMVRKVDELITVVKTRAEADKKKEEAQKEAASQATTPPYVPFPVPYPPQAQGAPSKILQLSASAVVNAPRAQVWEVLNEVVYVPTCGELLDSVEVLGKLANALTWEGTVRAGRREFPVEGTTTLYPPTRMEVACHRGALQGFRGSLNLVDVPEGTRLMETAEFDPSSLPDEFAPVANALRAKGSEILIRDLEHFDQLVRALASPQGEPETPE